MRKRRKFLLLCVILAILSITCIIVCDSLVRKSAKGKLYSNIQQLPYHKVGLLLGTSKYLGGGYFNPYYTNRLEAATSLLKSGKIRYLVISGDNSRHDYNEPGQMREDLVKAGIDFTRLYLDYAGFRTFDSIVRLREIFSQNDVTVISQPFHNERAIYIASKEGIAAVGFNAKEVSQRIGFKVRIREKFARVKVFIDYVVGTQPKFLGPKISIP